MSKIFKDTYFFNKYFHSIKKFKECSVVPKILRIFYSIKKFLNHFLYYNVTEIPKPFLIIKIFQKSIFLQSKTTPLILTFPIIPGRTNCWTNPKWLSNCGTRGTIDSGSPTLSNFFQRITSNASNQRVCRFHASVAHRSDHSAAWNLEFGPLWKSSNRFNRFLAKQSNRW